MDITVSDQNITYNSITVKKITISSISIDPLKRIANFTVSYWNGTVFLGNESYTYKATYIQPIQPVLKSLSVPSTTSYTITINATIGSKQYYQPPFTSLFPYLTSGLQIYYNQKGDISLELSTDISTLTTASYAYGGKLNNRDMLSIFYTVGDVQYNVKIEQPVVQPKLCHGGITTLYTNSGNSSLSVTTDPINFNIPVPIGTNTLNVQSEPNTTVSNSAIQTNIYNGYEATPIYKSVSALPTLSIYYNPNNISDISASSSNPSNPYTLIARNVFFTSVTFKSTDTYQFSNLSYTALNTNGTSVIVTFQSKQLTITSQIEPAPIYCNPLNTSDIGFQDEPANYKNLISIMSSTPTPTPTTTSSQIYTLIQTFNTTKNKTVSMDSTKGTLSIP